MTKIKSITIGVDVNDIIVPVEIKKINIGELMSKHNFSIVEQTNEDKLSMITNELLENNNIVIGYACFNIEEIVQINHQLKKHNLSLDTVFIPSEERINLRVQKAIEEQRRWGYREGVTDEEIERNFNTFRTTLQAIKEGLKDTSIKLKAV